MTVEGYAPIFQGKTIHELFSMNRPEIHLPKQTDGEPWQTAPANSSRHPLIPSISIRTLLKRRLTLDLRISYAKENLAPDQAPRTEQAHELITSLKMKLRQIEQTPATTNKIAKEIIAICDRFLNEPEASAGDTEFVDTYKLRADIDRMIEAKSPESIGIPKYAGGTSEEAKSFFLKHYGEKYNRHNFQVIFAPDLREIDSKLMRALRSAYVEAKSLPLGDREALTDAIIAGRFGSNTDRIRANHAVAQRHVRILNYGVTT